MKRKNANLLIRIASLAVFLLGIILSLAVLFGALLLSFSNYDFNLSKLIAIDIGLFVVALLILLVFIGIYEFFISFIKLEEEIEKIEKEVVHDQGINND